jgi:hypothetical protein
MSSLTWETVRRLALALPQAEEGTSYGTPAFRVRGKLFVRLHQCGDSIVIKLDRKERTMRMEADPKAFYITDHYLSSSWMLVRLSAIRRGDLREVLVGSWRRSAPPRLVAAYDATQPQ